MSQAPVISVIMSVYNGEAYLREAVLSVCRQSFADWELIVIDDCSTDGTAAILKELASGDARIKVHKNEVNLRLPASLNKAISLAKGRYVARMDADDICLENRLEQQLAFMERHPQIMLSSCRYMTLRDGAVASGGGGAKTDAASLKALLLLTNPILHPGVIARTSALRALPYNAGLTCTEDMELWTRFAKENYPMAIQNEYLLLYRIHGNQITGTTRPKQYQEVLGIVKSYFPQLFDELSEDEAQFYIHGIYFREAVDVKRFRALYRRAVRVNRQTGFVPPKALSYAFFEILAEYKRCGLSKADLMRGLLCFNPFFAAGELIARKKRARADGQKCIAAAQAIGLRQVGGSVSFPQFDR